LKCRRVPCDDAARFGIQMPQVRSSLVGDFISGRTDTTRIPSAGTALACAVALVAGLCPALAADQVPNLKGKWAGKTYSIVAGVAPHWPSNRGTFDKPGLFDKDLVIEVTNQEGRRFWGKQSFSGGGEQTSEPMIGELTGKDNKTVVLVDTDGFLDGQLVNNNTMTFCYKQAGGRTESSVVSCSELKRTP
jgi:hypothetical protein